MKRWDTGRFNQAWGGIGSLAVALAAVHTLHPDLADLTRWLSAAPARLAGLASYAGALLPGREASFLVFDPEASWTVSAVDLHTRHPISPYLGHRLTGRVRSTWLRGEPIYQHGTFSAHHRGQELRG